MPAKKRALLVASAMCAGLTALAIAPPSALSVPQGRPEYLPTQRVIGTPSDREELEHLISESQRTGRDLEELIADEIDQSRGGETAIKGLADGQSVYIESADPVIDDLSEVDITDLKATATRTGEDLATVISARAGQEDFTMAATSISDIAAERVTDFGFTEDGGPWIAFSGTASDEALVRLLNVGREVSVIENMGFDASTRAEAMKRAIAMGESCHHHIDASVEGISRTIFLRAFGEKPGVACQRPLTVVVDGASFTLQWTDHPYSEALAGQESYRAGGLFGDSTGWDGCTSGFTFVKSGNLYTSTAGHCYRGGSSQYFRGRGQEYQKTGRMTYGTRHYSGNGDWAMYVPVAPLSATPTMYVGISENRRARARYVRSDGGATRIGVPPLNQEIYYFGLHSRNTESARVKKIFWSKVGAVVMPTKVMVDRSITQPGDSGGPWFYGTSALGIHRGRTVDASCKDPKGECSDYTPVWFPRLSGFKVKLAS